MPERAGKWTTQTLSFSDCPEDTFTIRYRDPLEAIHSLWADPGLAQDFVFAPQKVFSDKSKSKRIYNEMWTGKWWHVLQVCPSQDIFDCSLSSKKSRPKWGKMPQLLQ